MTSIKRSVLSSERVHCLPGKIQTMGKHWHGFDMAAPIVHIGGIAFQSAILGHLLDCKQFFLLKLVHSALFLMVIKSTEGLLKTPPP